MNCIKCQVKLSGKQKKFCSCIAQVKRRSRGRVYNPYPICAKSTGTSMGRASCLGYYNFGKSSGLGSREIKNIAANERKALARRRRKSKSRSKSPKRKRRNSSSGSPRRRRRASPASPRRRRRASPSQLLRSLKSLANSKY